MGLSRRKSKEYNCYKEMKIPEGAKKVFEGVIFDVYQWEQRMFDGSTATFEALKRPNTVQIIPVKDSKILLAYESQPNRPSTYTFFGGRVEKGEKPINAAKRELLEETGLESEDWELFKAFEFESKIEWTIHLYIARVCKKVSEPNLDSGEKIEIKAVDFDQFLKITADESFWGQQIANDIFRLKESPKQLTEFKKKLFK
jgi:ADP-ribose pyrophosphatase